VKMFNSDDHISVRMCFIIFILFIMLLSDFLAVSVRGLQPFLGTDIDYGASPVDLQGLVQLEVQFVNELVPFCKAVGVNIKHEDAIQRSDLVLNFFITLEQKVIFILWC